MEGNTRGERGDDAPPAKEYTKEPHEPGDGTRSTPEAWRAYLKKEEEVFVTEEAKVKVTGLLKLCAKPSSANLGTGREYDPLWDDVRRFLREATDENRKAAAEEVKEFGMFPLYVACGCKPPVDVVEDLLNASPETALLRDDKPETVCRANDAGLTPLHMACRNGASEGVVHLLIDRGGGKDACWAETKDGWTPLHFACRYGASEEVVWLLIDRGGGTDVCFKTNVFGSTPLHNACEYGASEEVVRLLIDMGGGVEACSKPDENGYTPLHIACEHGASEEVLRLLIDRGGGEEACYKTNEAGITPLHIACRSRASEEVIRLLIDNGGGENACWAKTKNGVTPLHFACSDGASEEVVRLLIDKGGGKEACWAKTKNGVTPLHSACRNRASEKVVRLLIDRGGGEEVCLAETMDGDTPLHSACRYGASEEVVCLLIEKGGATACKRIQPFTGRFPLYYALGYDTDGFEKGGTTQISDKTIRLIIQNGGAEPLSDLIDVSRKDKKKCLGFKETREALNRGFTRRPVLALMMLYLYFQGFLVAVMSLATNQSLKNNVGIDAWQLFLLVLPVLWFSIWELMQMKTYSYQAYITDFWNWIDISQIILVSASIATMNSGRPINTDTPGRVLLTVTVGIVWLALLGVMKNFLYDIAVFVSSLQQILVKLIPFLVVTTVTITAFVFMFHSANINASYCESYDMEERWYCGMIGQLFAKLSSFVLAGLVIDMDIIQESGTTAGILYAFGIIIALIFLNVLIAKISNVFSDVEQSGNEVFWTNRFSVVLEAQLVLTLFSPIFTTGKQKEPKKRTRFSKVIFFADEWKTTRDQNDEDETTNVQQLITRPRGLQDWEFSDYPTGFLYQELFRVCCRLFVPILVLVFFVIGLMSCGVLWPKWMTQWLFFGKEDSGINDLDTVSDKMAQFGGRIENKISESEVKTENQMKHLGQRVTVIESKISTLERNVNQLGERMKGMEKKLDTLLEAVVKLNGQ